ncbi:MAG: 3-dehydroquinate dehydratase, partial [Verrucomicrobia bacterium]|nr:3-dehydroquinate dehydratase [Verrucomicrobiota bacterium]
MKKIGLLNGPNLDRLGKREPDIYGSETLEEIVQQTESLGTTLGCEVHAYQSNHEGSLIDQIHQWADLGFSGLIINPGGFTHTSVALRDAISASGLKTV